MVIVSPVSTGAVLLASDPSIPKPELATSAEPSDVVMSWSSLEEVGSEESGAFNRSMLASVSIGTVVPSALAIELDIAKGQKAPAVRGSAKAMPAEARTAQKTMPEAQYVFLP
jgi:hypothetical protein